MPSYTLAAIFLLAGVMTVIAPQKPDFSGEWKSVGIRAAVIAVGAVREPPYQWRTTPCAGF